MAHSAFFADPLGAALARRYVALLVGGQQPWLSTEGFLDKVDENLQKALA